MKRTWMGFVLALLLCAALSPAASAETQKLNIKVSAADGVLKAGETFAVVVSLYNYSSKAIQDIGGIQLDIPIDTEYLEYVSGSDEVLLKTESGDSVSKAYHSAVNQYSFMYESRNEKEKALPRKNTDVFSLKLKLKKDIPEGKTFDITCKAVITGMGSPSEPIPADVFFAQITSSELVSLRNDEALIDSSAKEKDNGSSRLLLTVLLVLAAVFFIGLVVISLYRKNQRKKRRKMRW